MNSLRGFPGIVLDLLGIRVRYAIWPRNFGQKWISSKVVKLGRNAIALFAKLRIAIFVKIAKVHRKPSEKVLNMLGAGIFPICPRAIKICIIWKSVILLYKLGSTYCNHPCRVAWSIDRPWRKVLQGEVDNLNSLKNKKNQLANKNLQTNLQTKTKNKSFVLYNNLEHIKGKESMHWKNGLEMRWLKKIGTYVLNWNELFKFFNSVSLNRPAWSRDKT